MDEKPKNCRNRLRDEGKSYPRSGCDHCGNGGLMGCPFEKNAGQLAVSPVNPNDLNAKVLAFIASARDEAKKLNGREVRILSNYNGQSYGRSKKSLKGKIMKIASASVYDGGLTVFLEGYEYGCPGLHVHEWELV